MSCNLLRIKNLNFRFFKRILRKIKEKRLVELRFGDLSTSQRPRRKLKAFIYLRYIKALFSSQEKKDKKRRKQKMKIITKDLFEASYFLAKGILLQDVISNNKTVLFQFDEKDQLENLKSNYISGNAIVNVHHLKNSMNHLKDIMFSKLRQNQTVA